MPSPPPPFTKSIVALTYVYHSQLLVTCLKPSNDCIFYDFGPATGSFYVLAHKNVQLFFRFCVYGVLLLVMVAFNFFDKSKNAIGIGRI